MSKFTASKPVATQENLDNWEKDWSILYKQISTELGSPAMEDFPRKRFLHSVPKMLSETLHKYMDYSNITWGTLQWYVQQLNSAYPSTKDLKLPFARIYLLTSIV